MSNNTGKETERKFNSSTTCGEILKGLDLTGKTIAITGTTNGIGIETARHLALAGAHVICLNRNEELSEARMEAVKEENDSVEMSFIKCDLSSLASIREAAEELMEKHKHLDVLILNAGVSFPVNKSTSDGLESIFGVNHVGHFHLTTLLIPLLESSAPSRIVIVSSEAHKWTLLNSSSSTEEKVTALMPDVENYGTVRGFVLYSLSKLCNVLFAMKLHRDLQGTGVNVYVLHPGVIMSTNLGSETGGWAKKVISFFAAPFCKSLDQGAATTVYCAVHPDTDGISGKYWDACNGEEKTLKKELAQDVELQEELWKRTEKLIEEIEKKWRVA